MILTDREISIALENKQLIIDPAPTPESFSSTSVDLTLAEQGLEWIALDAGFNIRPGHAGYQYSKAARFQEQVAVTGYTLRPKTFRGC